MSGFIVQVAIHKARRDLSGPLETMNHRGPDDSGFWIQGDNTFFMGHCRSSHFDLSESAHQPIADPFSSLHLVFDGEIYNFREVREELKGSHTFRTDTDTEVLLAAYRHWGADCLERLNGIFSFVLWDEYKSEIFAARDHFGVKPLYYFVHKGMGITLASEIKALHASGALIKSPNRPVWNAFMLHGLSDYSDETFWEQIYQVPPGGWLSWSFSKGVQKGTWYDLPGRVMDQGMDTRTDDEVEEELLHLMDEAVRQRYRTESPLGACLSGSVDSSMLLGLIQRAEGRDTQFPFVAMKCDDPLCDDSGMVTQVLQHTNHKLIFPELRPDFFPDMVGGLKYFLDEPFELFPCMKLAVLHYFADDEGIRTLLWSDGLDEGWGGYRHYLEAQTGDGSKTAKPAACPDWMQKEFFESAEELELPSPFENTSLNLQYHDLRYKTLPRKLRYLDRVSSAYSMGCRLPFLDYRIIELGFRQPDERRIKGGRGKTLPRNLVKKLLPDDFLDRPDLDATTVEQNWLTKDLSKWAQEQIEAGLKGYGEDWLNPAAVRSGWEKALAGESAGFPVWRLVALGLYGEKPFFIKG